MSKHFLDNNGLLYVWNKVKNLVGTKVDKVEGKNLSTNDYTNEDKAKLESLENYTLEAATEDKLGGVKVGTGLSVAADGTVSADEYNLEAATEDKLGGVKVGTGLSVGEDGKLNADGYTLPTATAEKMGGVKIGEGITVNGDGVISVNEYTLPTATAGTLGGVKVGTGINLGDDGTISVVSQGLTSATADTLGGVKVGDGLTIDENGKMSVNEDIIETDWTRIKNKPNVVLKEDMVNVYIYKGSVANPTSLPVSTEEDPVVPGSVYNIESTGMNVAWTGEAWDELGEVFQIEAMTNAEIDEIMA